MLIAGLEPLLPLGARNTALLIGWVAALVAAAGLFALGSHLHDRRVGFALAVLWGCLPHSVVLTMAYTEALFTALAVWALLALLRRNWLTAGVLCLVAGLSRPTATALIGVVGLAGLIAVFRRQDGWRPWAAVVMAPLGWIGYIGWVAVQTGRIDGWFHLQRAGWGSYFDGGRYTLRVAHDLLGKASALNLVVVTLLLFAAATLVVLGLLDRQPWQLVVFGLVMVVMTVGSAGYYHSKGRFLLPAATLLLPLAVVLGRAGRAKAGTVLVALALASAWYGGHLMLIWTYSP
ncbi:hypothetical protein CA850_12480 [Micromonospora echinospora]|nr:hypothetical protein CA850_12480 [Micromonospora echinospora]